MTAPILTTPRSGYGGRGYRIPGRDRPYPGVTTVLNQVAKPALIQWAVDVTAARAVTNLPMLMQRTEEVGFNGLRWYWSKDYDVDDPNFDPDLRTYHHVVKNDRAELGTNIHGHMEADLGGGVYPPLLSEETAQMLDAWDEFLTRHIIVSHRAEFTVVNDTYGYAGTADADWSIACGHGGPPCLTNADNRPIRTLVDLKSSRHTWREHGHQMGGLALAEVIMVQVAEGTEGAQLAEKTQQGKKIRSWWLEEPLPQFEDYALLHIRPDDLDADGDHVNRFCELKPVKRIDLHQRGFLAALELAIVEYALKAEAKADAKAAALMFDTP